MGDGIHLCRGCGMVWTPGEFYNQKSQIEVDLDFAGYDGESFALEDMDPACDEFTACPLCGSDNVVGLVDYSGDLAGRMMCATCGCEFSVLEGMDAEAEEEENIHADILVCPHCASVDSIVVYGDNEWCGECWLDPNELNQDSESIAELFKGGIKRALGKDVPMLRFGKSYGNFVREECGPHCSLSKSCPQDTGILIKCFQEELSSGEEDSQIVGKRKRGKKGKGRRRNKLQNQAGNYGRKGHKHVPSKVAFSCAPGGLLEKMILYGTRDPDTEQPGNTGSQSGA
jgi:hypothetical protein